MTEVLRNSAATRGRSRRPWLRVGLTGLLLWFATVVVTVVTGNTNLIPTVVLLGSFLVPVTFVVWAWQHTDTGELTSALLFSTFVVGGVIGILGASVLESFLLRPSWWLFLGVGAIEEAVKLAALAFVTRHLAHKSVRDGMILGASVGFGFAAFESAGYALTALFTTEGLSLAALVKTELLRGLLAPVGHGLWTAILGGVLFRASTRHRFTLTGRLLAALVGVSLLHGLWDAMHSIAVRGTLVLTNGEQYVPTQSGWLVRPSAEQAALMPVLEWAGMGLIALIGVVWLVVEWRSARRADPAVTPRLSWHVPIRSATG